MSRMASMRRPTSDGDRVERGAVVRQQPASAGQSADLERVVRRLGDRHVDGRDAEPRAAGVVELAGERRRPSSRQRTVRALSAGASCVHRRRRAARRCPRAAARARPMSRAQRRVVGPIEQDACRRTSR